MDKMYKTDSFFNSHNLFHFAIAGWVHGVSFDANGDRLAWVSHDSTVSVVNAAADFAISQTRLRDLPCLTLQWVGPHNIVAGVSNSSLWKLTYYSTY